MLSKALFYREIAPKAMNFGKPWPMVKKKGGLPPTNALQAIHAIALKEGFPAEEIMSVRPANEANRWIYTLINSFEMDHFINLSNKEQ